MGREKGSPRNAIVDSPSVWMGSDVTEHLGVTAWFVCFSVAPARAGTRVCEHKTVYRNDARSAQDPQPVRATHTQECSPPKKSVSEESLSIITARQKSAKMTGLSRSVIGSFAHLVAHTPTVPAFTHSVSATRVQPTGLNSCLLRPRHSLFTSLSSQPLNSNLGSSTMFKDHRDNP